MAKAKVSKVTAGGKAKAPAAKPKVQAPAKAAHGAPPKVVAKAARPAAAPAPVPASASAKKVVSKPGSRPAPKAAAVKPGVTAAVAPAAVPASPVAAAPAGPGAVPGDTSGITAKKKVKRGAPPMLPRRMARRPMPAAPGSEGSSPPPPHKATVPGSLHAPARVPEGAEGLKARLMAVMGDLARLRGLKRSINKQFWEAGSILANLSKPELYQAKGYGSWEAFLEREVERELAIGRTLAMELVRIVKLFRQEPAEEVGLERLRAAVRAIWPEPGTAAAAPAPPTGGGTQAPWDPESGGA